MHHVPPYRILLLCGVCLLVAGLLLPLFPFNGLVVVVALVCVGIGYSVYPLHGVPERLLHICFGMMCIFLVLSYFYAPQWLPRTMLDLARPLLRLFVLLTLGVGAYVQVHRSHATNQ